MLTPMEKRLHERALDLGQRHRRLEAELIEVLQQVEASQFYRKLNKPSLFAYATEILSFSEAVAYSFISVCRKALIVPELQVAIGTRQLSVQKAARFVSVLTTDNASELIGFALESSSRKIDKEVVRRNPKKSRRDRIKPISEKQSELLAMLEEDTIEIFQRVQALERQKSSNFNDTLKMLAKFYLDHKDPLEKANRAMERKNREKPELCPGRSANPIYENTAERTPLTAEQKTHRLRKRRRQMHPCRYQRQAL